MNSIALDSIAFVDAERGGTQMLKSLAS